MFVLLFLTGPAFADTAWDFGGMYGYYNGGSYNNPATNSTSCPSGYTSYLVYGTPSVDWSMYFCGRPHVSGQDSLYDFGGMIGLAGSAAYYAVPWRGYFYYVNPFTHTDACPPGYTRTQVLGTPSVDNVLFFCWRLHSSDTSTASMYFGGMTGDGSPPFSNPATGSPYTCPPGYSAYPALGTPSIDYRFFYCGIPQNSAAVLAGAGSLGIGEPIVGNVATNGWSIAQQVDALNGNGINARVFRLWTLATDLLAGPTQVNVDQMQVAKSAVAALQGSGITVLGMDGTYPTWMTGSSTWGKIPCRNTAAGSTYQNFLDNFESSWSTMSRELSGISLWEPANETNGLLVPDVATSGLCPSGHAGTFSSEEAAAITTDLMYRAHRAIHANVPGAIVFMPPPSPNPHGDDFDQNFNNIADFIALIYGDIASTNWPSQNPRDYFDGASWHPYISGDATQASWVEPNTTVYNVLVGQGDGSIPIIFSETGYSVCASGCSTSSQAVAAAWMADAVTLSQKDLPWLTYLIYFRAFQDSAGFGIMSSPSVLPGNSWFTTATSNPNGTAPSGFCYFTGCSYPSPKP
jgi:hypothetical protein